ncbi:MULTISPECIES: reductive dehalogenase [unclassified Dehalobacter]|uniref:reductive dehalogenase n=1 Tax=unclassified Dehalobacter TaxID=2635733 RepID=UPI000E6BDF29|nr:MULTISPECIES: reductive dehalogenase [unclassified Dehalobacter]RJE48652.1 tetrachloroethene dehalogenase [Dehalobacter sp. MCB1]TCX47266.1 reductive dehalogenase [Dehalobacter sp. 14DCB1]TCX55688.1 reductive dehalogenase [Dehalobacter sp. 12DCB1]
MGNNINRRGFLKASLLGAAAAAVASATVAKETFSPLVAEAADIVAPVQELSEFPYKVTENYKRFPADKNLYLRVYEPEENKKPVKFVIDDVSKISGKKDTGKDLPLLNAEKLGIKGRPATLVETGLSYYARYYGPDSPINEDGWTLLDQAFAAAGFFLEKDASGFTAIGCGPSGIIQRYPIDPATNESSKQPVFVPGLYTWDSSSALALQKQGKNWKFKSPEEASKIFKKASKLLGADLVGIAPYDERWTYSQWARPRQKAFTLPGGRTAYLPYNKTKFLATKEAEVYGNDIFEADFVKYAGFKPKSIITFAVEMDYESTLASPSAIADASTGLGYSNMAEVAYKIAAFLRNLGYGAIPSGNDTSLTVPIAVQAGLGEVGRNGLLITQKYGPRVRIAKVYTDLEIAPDKPVKFGVREFCRLCKKCADACPGQAISHEKEARVIQPEDCGPSENPYVEKWHVDAARCNSFWGLNCTSCSNCVAVCSWNKLKTWNHDVARIATQVPVVQNAARKFDEWFGYGGPVDPDERISSGYVTNKVRDFWNNPDLIK